MYGGSGDACGPNRLARKVGRALVAQCDTQRGAALPQRIGGNREWIAAQLAHLVFVELDDIEAAEPGGCLRQRARYAHPVRLLTQEKAVQVGIHESGKATAQELRGFEIHFEAGDEIDVQGVEVVHLWYQLG